MTSSRLKETEMKKTRFRIISYLAAMTVVSMTAACSSGEDVEEVCPTPQPQTFTVTARQSSDDSNGAPTRVGFDSNGAGFWQKGDVIGIWSKDEGKFKPFTIASGAGTGTATFTGTIVGELENYAVALYPYNEKDDIEETGENSGVATINFPNTYTYTSVDKEVSAVEGNSFNARMLGNVSGTGTTDREISFKHLGGVLVLVFDKIPQEGTVTVTAESAICGNAQITDNDTVTNKELKYVSTDESSKKVTFSYKGAEKMQSGVFYLPLLEGTYNNLTVTLKGANPKWVEEVQRYDTIHYEYSTTFSPTIKRTYLKKKSIKTDYTITVYGHKFIDLGLPNGLLWAECNIGAANDKDYEDGDYFTWGSTEPKPDDQIFCWYTNYKFGGSSGNECTKYNATDNLTTLEKEDDAAYVNWGPLCRMPSKEEMSQIISTSSEYTSLAWEYGLKITSKTNGRTLFLPNSVYYANDEKYPKSDECYLWTSDVYVYLVSEYASNRSSANAGCYCSNITNNKVKVDAQSRCIACPVRAVVEP